MAKETPSAKIGFFANVSFSPKSSVSVFPFETLKIEAPHAVCFKICFLFNVVVFKITHPFEYGNGVLASNEASDRIF